MSEVFKIVITSGYSRTKMYQSRRAFDYWWKHHIEREPSTTALVGYRMVDGEWAVEVEDTGEGDTRDTARRSVKTLKRINDESGHDYEKRDGFYACRRCLRVRAASGSTDKKPCRPAALTLKEKGRDAEE